MGLEYDLPKQMCSSSSREEKSLLFLWTTPTQNIYSSEWWEMIRSCYDQEMRAWSQYTHTPLSPATLFYMFTPRVSCCDGQKGRSGRPTWRPHENKGDESFLSRWPVCVARRVSWRQVLQHSFSCWSTCYCVFFCHRPPRCKTWKRFNRS